MTEEEKIKAMRLARAIASDISLYNEQKIIKGIEQDNLFEVLKDEIEEGRELYKSRVSQELYTTTNFFDRAIPAFPEGPVRDPLRPPVAEPSPPPIDWASTEDPGRPVAGRSGSTGRSRSPVRAAAS